MNTSDDTTTASAQRCGARGEHPWHGCGPRRCGPMGAGRGGALAPWGPWSWRHTPVNIEETDEAFLLRLLAPGLDKQQLQVSVQGDVLGIRYQAPTSTEGARRFTRLEWPMHDFVREFALNGLVQVEAIQAVYAEGMLTVTLPKTPEARQAERQVPVQ